jgi:Fe2+ transport system protein FeoA
MLFSSLSFGETYEVLDIVKNNPYTNCMGCFIINLFDLGIVPGSKIKVKKFISDTWLVEVFSDNSSTSKTLAVRNENNYRVLVK